MTDLTNTAPKRIYLDIGDQFALERVASGDLRWDLLDGVTWSEDNATSHGIPYVRADLVPTPAASGAAPADQREKDFHDWFAANYSGDVVFSDPRWHSEKVLRAARRALASPQVAPAPTDEQRLASVQERLVARGVRSIHFAWNEGASDKSKQALTRAVISNLEKLLDGDFKQVQFVGDAPALAAPVQVAPTLTRQQIDAAQEAADHKHGVHTWGEAPGSWRETFANEIARAVAAPAPVAPQDDARDAAEDDDLTALDICKLVYALCEDIKEKSNDDSDFDRGMSRAASMIAREVGAVTPISTPAAKPTEEQGS